MIAFLTDGWTEQTVSASNGALAWVACIAHIVAAVSTSGWLRRMFISIGSLALLYSFAYWWLFFNPERVQEWSDFLRPFGVITWVLAWSIEPLVLVFYLRRRGREIVGKAEEAAQGPRRRLDEKDRAQRDERGVYRGDA